MIWAFGIGVSDAFDKRRRARVLVDAGIALYLGFPLTFVSTLRTTRGLQMADLATQSRYSSIHGLTRIYIEIAGPYNLVGRCCLLLSQER
jgi:hypothetical protein